MSTDSNAVKKYKKFPIGDLEIDNKQKLRAEKCNLTAHTSRPCSLQNSFKFIVENCKVS